MRDNPDENFLRRVAGIFWMPQHAQRQAIDSVLNRAHKVIERIGVPTPCAFDESSDFVARYHCVSTTRLSVASSFSKVRVCSSSTPSSCSNGTGGALSTNEYTRLLRSAQVSRDIALPTVPSSNVIIQSIVPASCAAVTLSAMLAVPLGVRKRAVSLSVVSNASAHAGRFFGSAMNANAFSYGAMISMLRIACI